MSRGLGFALLCDHGMEPVERVFDLRKLLQGLDLPVNSYDVFIENTKATFWFTMPTPAPGSSMACNRATWAA